MENDRYDSLIILNSPFCILNDLITWIRSSWDCQVSFFVEFDRSKADGESVKLGHYTVPLNMVLHFDQYLAITFGLYSVFDQI